MLSLNLIFQVRAQVTNRWCVLLTVVENFGIWKQVLTVNILCAGFSLLQETKGAGHELNFARLCSLTAECSWQVRSAVSRYFTLRVNNITIALCSYWRTRTHSVVLSIDTPTPKFYLPAPPTCGNTNKGGVRLHT